MYKMYKNIDIQQFIPARPTVVARERPGRTSLLEGISSRKKITDRQKVAFCTQLAVMIQARVPLHKALDALLLQTKEQNLKKAIQGISGDLKKGLSLSGAFGNQPHVFDDLFVVTAEVGQESGRLGEVLMNLAQHLEKVVALKKKVVQALTYPALVLTVAAFAVVFLLVFIVPTFAEMFRSFQMDLPWSTQVVLQLSESMATYGPIMLIGLILLASASKQLAGNPNTVRKMEPVFFRIPFLGDVLLKNYVARFCRTLGMLLHARISLVEALVTSRRIITNQQVNNEIGRMTKLVRKGGAIADSLFESSLFPPMVAQMIMVGEETSELDNMLLKVAEFYEKEIDGKVETLSTLIEPVIVLILGLFVAGILIAMYLPMFDLVNVMGGM